MSDLVENPEDVFFLQRGSVLGWVFQEALDEGLLLQRGIDLLLDRNIAEQFGSAVPQGMVPCIYCNNFKFSDGKVLANNADPDQTVQQSEF